MNHNTALIVLDGNQSPSLENTSKIYTLYQAISADAHVVGITPAYSSISVVYDSIVDIKSLQKKCAEILSDTPNVSIDSVTHVIPVTYLCNEDFEHVCKTTSLSYEEVIELHTKPLYTVAMVGFRPYFPYLIGMHESLKVPRKGIPSRRIEPGSVAIGGIQTGIYSEASPGGWWVIGGCDTSILKHIKMGDRIKFEAK